MQMIMVWCAISQCLLNHLSYGELSYMQNILFDRIEDPVMMIRYFLVTGGRLKKIIYDLAGLRVDVILPVSKCSSSVIEGASIKHLPNTEKERPKAMSHTILLVQPTKRPEGRTYADYESVNECMEGVCKMYEEHLKRMNPSSPSITYDISQLFDFIDDLADLSCLVYRGDTQTYQPYNKDWIKEKIYVLLRRQAQQAGK
ncbi:unnamed protein product [Boreogadus saida]